MLDFPSSRGRSTMKLKSPLVLSVCAFLGLTAALLHSGCETAEDFTIDVTPHNSEVTAPDQTVTLTASGWSGYVWSLVPENWEWGYLSGQTGKTVTFVVTGMPSTTQTLTVKATGAGSSYTSASNSVQGVSGTARIRHVVSSAGAE